VLRKTQYSQQMTPGTPTTVVHETNTLIVNGQEIGSSSDDKEVKSTFNSDYVPTGGFAGTTSYTVQAGDSLQSIAKAFWGDSNLWFLIADANGMSAVTPGLQILIPPKPNTATDNASTFKPYDPSKAIGNTTPTTPVPMPQGHHGGCGGFGKVLVVVIAVAAAAFTAGVGAVLASGGTLATATAAQLAVAGMGALGGTFGVGVAAAAGAVGSIAGQAVAVATGNQDDFSWKQVALSAVSAGVTGGLGGVDFTGSGALQGTGNMVARAAVGNAITQAAGVATGLQHSFSWQAVAASAVGAGVGQAVGGELDNAWGGTPMGNFAARAGAGFAAGGAAALARGGKVAVQQVATDAFGNALGQGLVDNSTSDARRATEAFQLSDEVYAGADTTPAPYTGRGLRVGGRLGLSAAGDTLKDWSDGIDGGIALYAQRDLEIDAQAVQARAVAQQRAAQLRTAQASTKVVSERDDNSTPLPSFTSKPATAVAAPSNSLWNRIGSIDTTLIPGVGWLSREQAASSAQTWKDKLDATGNPVYAGLEGVATLWSEHADEVAMALSMRGGPKGVAPGDSGAFGSLKGLKGDGLTAHHIPQAAAGRTGYNEGGALVMTQEEHIATRTYGSKGIGTLEADESLSFREVLARDFADVRSIVGSKYNEGLRNLLEYYRKNFPGLMGK
jgi:LysM repeat protein